MITYGQLMSLFPQNKYFISDSNRILKDVVIMEKNIILNQNILYIGYVSFYHTLNLSNSNFNFLLIQDEPLYEHSRQDNLLLLENTDDIYDILKIVQENLFQSNIIDQQALLECFLVENDLDVFCEKCAVFLHNPIIITDSNYNIIAHSHPKIMKDPIWKTGWSRGNLTFEFIACLQGEKTNYFESDSSSQIVIVEGISNNRRKVCKLQMKGNFLGYLIILEHDQSFDQNDQTNDLFAISLLSKHLSMNKTTFTSSFRKKELNILVDLIDHKIMNYSIFKERIQHTHLEDEAIYQVFFIEITDIWTQDHIVQDQLRQELMNLLKNSYTLLHNCGIVVLTQFNFVNQENIQAIERFLKLHQLKAGCSDYFHDLFHLYNFYEQSVHALSFKNFVDEEKTIYYYEKIRFYHLLSYHSPKELSLFCNQKILKLSQDDEINQTNYFLTLFYYLKYNRSIQKTADKCFVHRNTINYRITKIRELYHIFPEDEEKTFNYLYSCAIIHYLQVEKALEHN